MALLVVGLVCEVLSVWMVVDHGRSALMLVAPIYAIVTGAKHITKLEAPR